MDQEPEDQWGPHKSAKEHLPFLREEYTDFCNKRFWTILPTDLVLAPPKAMQFGRALKRVLQRIYKANPKFGPVYLSKIDISDGFYRIAVRTEDVSKLDVLFPT